MPGGGGGAETGKLNALLAVLFPASVACAVKLNWPVCVVVPDNWPVLLRTNPCGSEPDAIFH